MENGITATCEPRSNRGTCSDDGVTLAGNDPPGPRASSGNRSNTPGCYGSRRDSLPATRRRSNQCSVWSRCGITIERESPFRTGPSERRQTVVAIAGYLPYLPLPGVLHVILYLPTDARETALGPGERPTLKTETQKNTCILLPGWFLFSRDIDRVSLLLRPVGKSSPHTAVGEFLLIGLDLSGVMNSMEPIAWLKTADKTKRTRVAHPAPC